jgi:hypothetical protein
MRTQAGIVASSSISISRANSRAFLSPCAAITPLPTKPAKRIDQLRALRHQHLARLVMHEHRLVRQRAHVDKAHRRPCHRFTDSSGVGRVILLPAHIGLDIGRRHDPDVMAKLEQLTRPIMAEP